MIGSNPSLIRGVGALLLAGLLGLPGCGGSDPADELVVLGAASLAEVFRELGVDFQRSRGEIPLVFGFAGSQTLATQLRAGIYADVVALAHPELLGRLAEEGRVEAPRVFATNRLVWVLRSDAGVRNPLELASSSWSVVLAAPQVPAGRYSREALDRLGLREAAEARLVSQELDVRGVIQKLRLAGADLGMAYATDVPPGDSELYRVELPVEAAVVAIYPVAVARASQRPERAAAFVAYLESPAARRILHAAGFGTP